MVVNEAEEETYLEVEIDGEKWSVQNLAECFQALEHTTRTALALYAVSHSLDEALVGDLLARWEGLPNAEKKTWFRRACRMTFLLCEKIETLPFGAITVPGIQVQPKGDA